MQVIDLTTSRADELSRFKKLAIEICHDFNHKRFWRLCLPIEVFEEKCPLLELLVQDGLHELVLQILWQFFVILVVLKEELCRTSDKVFLTIDAFLDNLP